MAAVPNNKVHLFWMAYPLAILCLIVSFSANRNISSNYGWSLDLKEQRWVDSVFNSLSLVQRVGQLFVLRAESDKGAQYEANLEQVIRKYQPGGLCFFKGTPEKQAELINRYQGASPRLPLLISIDAEWGLGMRLKKSAISFPRQLMLGAIQDDKLLYDMGREVARQCKRVGVHINFAPVADVNNNPSNPVINDRSFGEDRYNVAQKCLRYMQGMQDGGIMACAKHFPGHGDTDIDSHEDLPVIPFDRNRLDSLELYPFRVLSRSGVGSIMIAHLNVPKLDDRPHRPTTLSREVVTGLLRKTIGFDGLVITDAMEMKGVTKYFEPGEADVEALKAGNDIVLLPENVPASYRAVLQALHDEELSMEDLDNSVRRILRAKYRLGLALKPEINEENIRNELNTPEALLLKRQLVENAITLVRDEAGLCGFPDLSRVRIATVSIGKEERTDFQTSCGWYGPMDHFHRPRDRKSEGDHGLLDTLQSYDVVLVSMHDMESRQDAQFGVSDSALGFLQRLRRAVQHTGVVVFGNPYSLKFFDRVPLLICAYNDEPLTQEITAQAIFGAVDFRGKLPVTASPEAQFGQGIEKIFLDKRMAYDLPESVGMSSDTLALMDEIVQEMIDEGAAPGCQVLVARNNRIIWHKAYGYHTYEPQVPVKLDNLYDLASVTKVSATTLAMMQLNEQGCYVLDRPMGDYISALRETNKNELIVEDVLAHHARLTPWIPFYKETMDGHHIPNQHIYHREMDEDSPVPVAKDMYMINEWVDTLWSMIYRSDLRSQATYKYSDLGLYLSARLVEEQTQQRLDEYVDREFYKPLGLATTTYNPWKKGWTELCPPTEEDRYFRQQRLQGYVHDMGAAMLGGVSGHAGLFSNANDLAKIFQMLLNGGHYAGRQYLEPYTIQQFTTRYRKSTRRGLGFDMKELNNSRGHNMSELASASTFGHLGFTGNAVWADPEQQLIFIFLSNRTYPTMENNKIIHGDYRPRLQSIAYRAIKEEPAP